MAILLCMLFVLPQEEPSLEWDWIKGVRYVDPSRSLELHAGGLFAAYFVHVTTGVDVAWFRFRHEFVVGSLRGVETSQGKMNFLNQITSWSATLSCMLSGEPYDGRPLPGGEERGAGSWEIALRYANADIDRRFFEFGLTDYDRSSQEFRSFCGAVNWRPLRAVRVTAEGIRTIADQHPSGFGGSGRDTAFVFRVEFRF